MTVRPSSRSAVEPFHAMDVLAQANALAAAGKPVLSLAVGQPGDPAPAAVRETAARALSDGGLGYTDALGIPPLREAIAAHYADHYGVTVPVERIAVTTGSSAAFNLAFLALFDAGDRVAITAPGYPAYRNILAALGLEVVELPLAKGGWLTADDIEAEHRRAPLKGVLFASPANPTGSVIPAAELERIAVSARSNAIALISDEIYHRLNYSGPDVTALSLGDDITVINSFSKYYCMTGWRIGWMVLPQELVRPVERLQQNLYISAPALSQIAACEAFGAAPELDAIRDRYALSRQHLLEALPRLGFDIAAPMDGAFYAYCDVSRFTNDSMEFAGRMLREALVAATPGVDFDPVNGHRTMRFSYAGRPQDITEATQRIEAWLSGESL